MMAFIITTKRRVQQRYKLFLYFVSFIHFLLLFLLYFIVFINGRGMKKMSTEIRSTTIYHKMKNKKKKTEFFFIWCFVYSVFVECIWGFCISIPNVNSIRSDNSSFLRSTFDTKYTFILCRFVIWEKTKKKQKNKLWVNNERDYECIEHVILWIVNGNILSIFLFIFIFISFYFDCTNSRFDCCFSNVVVCISVTSSRGK